THHRRPVRLFAPDSMLLGSRRTLRAPSIRCTTASSRCSCSSRRPHVIREMFYVCRPGGIVSIPGVYGGLSDKIPFGAMMNKGLTIKTGQTHVNRWTDQLLDMIQSETIDPSFVITHTVS